VTPQIAAIIILGLGILAIAVWHLRPLKDPDDAGLSLIQEDHTDDLEASWALPAWQRDGAQ